MDPVVRVGDTVRRVAGEWTPAVHRLLDVLAGAKITQIPRAMGVDERGREVLSYLPGRQLTNAPPDVLWSERVLVQAAQLLRRIHDASEPLVHEGSLSWRAPIREPVEVVCHNDFATYNLIERDGVLSGRSTSTMRRQARVCGIWRTWPTGSCRTSKMCTAHRISTVTTVCRRSSMRMEHRRRRRPYVRVWPIGSTICAPSR